MRMSKNLVMATGLAAALLLAGCSVSHESSSTVTTEVTTDGTTETNSVGVTTSVGTDGASADISTTSDTVINVDDWEYGCIGTSTAGSTVF